MTRRFLAVTLSLTATIAFLVGLIVAGTMTPAPPASAPESMLTKARPTNLAAAAPALASIPDIAERLNTAVVNIDAAVRASCRTRRRLHAPVAESSHPLGRSFHRHAPR